MLNKLYILFAFVLFSAVQAFAQNVKPIQLSGTIKGFDGEKVYLQRYDNKLFKTIDSAEIAGGKFAFKTAVQLPELYGVSFHPDNIDLQLFLDGNPTTIDVIKDQDLRGAKIKGSELQEQYLSYLKRSQSLTAKSFIEEDPTSVVAAFVLFRNYSYELSPQEIREHVALLDPSLAQTQYVRILKDLADKQEAVLPGNKAIDFVSKDVDGNDVRFFDHLCKGYVLLDFWAGWCPLCRAENPNIVKAYQKYKDKGFTVFGVSLDKKRESWLKAIKDDQLDWMQVSDLAFWDTEAPALYGVRFIPSNLLIDPDGVIVARNVAGQELHDLLAELLDK